MDTLLNFRFVIIAFYIILFAYLFPKSGTTYDLFKLKLDLYPYWMKFISISLFIVFLILTFTVNNFFKEKESVLITMANLCLFIIVFSKERYEDEFSEIIRFKSFTYAFLTFITFAGVIGVTRIGENHPAKNSFDIYPEILIGLSLLVSITYFYYTKYKLFKKNDN